MFRIFCSFFLIGICLIPVEVVAYPTGNALLKEIQGKDFQKLSAIRYIVGVRHGLTLERAMAERQGRLGLLCIPDEVTDGQLNDMVASHLDTNPSTRHYPPAFLIVEAWSKFMCLK